MSMQSQLSLAFQRVATEINSVRTERGALANLTTTNKSSIVSAMNELKGLIDNVDVTGLIDDAETTATDKTYSIDQIKLLIQTAKDELTNGAGTAFDTLQELGALITDNDTDIAGILTAQANRVAVDSAQSFTAGQKTQARSNIDAVGTADMGDHTHDFVVTDFEATLS